MNAHFLLAVRFFLFSFIIHKSIYTLYIILSEHVPDYDEIVFKKKISGSFTPKVKYNIYDTKTISRYNKLSMTLAFLESTFKRTDLLNQITNTMP